MRVAHFLVAAALAAPQPSALDPQFVAIARAALKAHQEGRLDEAARGYQQVLEHEPRNVEILGNLGVVYAGLGRFDDAIQVYIRALDISYLNLPMRTNLALAYYKSGRCVDAIREFALVLESNPHAYNALLLSADCHVQRGNYDAAVGLLRPLAERANDDAFNYVLGMALLRAGQSAEAATYLDRILKRGDTAEARLLMGMAHRATADFAAAREEFGKAVALNPQLPLAHSLYGQALLSTGDREAARAAFLKELALNPTDFEASLYLGVILKEEQNYAEARQRFEKALSVRPQDPGAQYQMATLLVATGDNDAALKSLERLVAENPSFTEAHVSLATVYYRLKRRDDGDRHKAIAEKLTADAQARQPGAQALPAPPE
jgi:tetratricopeptide (TPR) repeat protein